MASIFRNRLWVLSALLLCASPQALLAQSSVTLDNSEALFTVLTAINACGFDAELAPSDPVRLSIREEVGRQGESSESAKASIDAICTFYRDHQQKNDALTLSEYVSLALYLNPPPSLSVKAKEADLPPDAASVLGLVPLLGKFYSEAGIHDIYVRHQPAYATLTNRYRDSLSKMIFDTELYLKLPSGSYLGRTFTIFVEPMGAPSETNARDYADEYYVVLTPGTNSTLKMDQIRHAYLHYLLDPAVGKLAANLDKLAPLMDALKLAPMEESFKSDPPLLVTECIIRAVEARTSAVGKPSPAEQERTIDQSMAQGFVLTRYFYDKLLLFEKDNIGFKNALPDMIAAIDVRKETKQAGQIEFASEADPELLHLSRPKETKLLLTAQERLSAGDVATAEKLAKQALAEKTEDAGRAWFILAQIALNRDIDGARDYFERALASTSEPKVVAWSHIYLGRILDLEDDEEGGPLRSQALAHYKAAEGASDSLPEAKKAAEQGLEHPYQPPDKDGANAAPGADKPQP